MEEVQKTLHAPQVFYRLKDVPSEYGPRNYCHVFLHHFRPYEDIQRLIEILRTGSNVKRQRDKKLRDPEKRLKKWKRTIDCTFVTDSSDEEEEDYNDNGEEEEEQVEFDASSLAEMEDLTIVPDLKDDVEFPPLTECVTKRKKKRPLKRWKSSHRKAKPVVRHHVGKPIRFKPSS